MKHTNKLLVITNILAVVLLAWLAASTIDVIATNNDPNATQAAWNIYTLITSAWTHSKNKGKSKSKREEHAVKALVQWAEH